MKNITIIGAGAVGRSIARALKNGGMPPAGIFSHQGKTAARLASSVGTRISGVVSAAVPLSGTVIIAVPDSEIRHVVSVIAGSTSSLRGTVVLHTSGALTSDELLPLKKLGAMIGSFHPLQTFSKRNIGTEFTNVYCAVEGDSAAVKRAIRLSKTLGSKYFVIRKKDKVLYHIAAVFASNYLVTVLSVAEQLAKTISLTEKEFRKIVRPLVMQTVDNVFHTSPEEALTGPIMRGDGVTVAKHIRKLETSGPLKKLLPLYSVLGIETAHLAKRRK